MLDRLNLSCENNFFSHLLSFCDLFETVNQISELCGLTVKNLPCLRSLDLHNNELTSTVGIKLPTLQKLYLAANKLTHLDGLEQLKQLTTLHLRDNHISTLDGFAPSMDGLQYLNLR